MTTEQVIVYLILPVIGYLLGSVPFGFVIGKFKGIDIRTVGSKNIGATNLGRTLGAKYFWYAFLLDAAKGFVPVLSAALLTRYFNARGIVVTPDQRGLWDLFTPHTLGGITGVTRISLPMWAPLITAVACWLGHLFPVWLGFKGGKGVATGFGVVLGFWPLYTLAGILAGIFFVFVLMIHRYISLASMTSAGAFVFFVLWLGSWNNPYVDTYLDPNDRWPLVGVAALFALVIVFRHRGNIVRLMKGTEPQIGQREVDKAKMPGPPKDPS